MVKTCIAFAVGALIAAASVHAQGTLPKPATMAAAAAPAGKVENGGVLYKKIGCYQCHANEAQGGLSGPRVGPGLIPYARFSQYIRKPTGEMPPYTTKVLSDQEIADIYAWVNARPKPPAVDSLPQLAR
jgi:ubiquinol-cytochrome c reductase cytochrome c subunit